MDSISSDERADGLEVESKPRKKVSWVFLVEIVLSVLALSLVFACFWQVDVRVWDASPGGDSFSCEAAIEHVSSPFFRLGFLSKKYQFDLIPSARRIRAMIGSVDPRIRQRSISLAFRDRNRLYGNEMKALESDEDTTVFILALIYLDYCECEIEVSSIKKLVTLACEAEANYLAQSAIEHPGLYQRVVDLESEPDLLEVEREEIRGAIERFKPAWSWWGP